jgi:hypothetical protein
MLLIIAEFREDRRKEGDNFLVVVNGIQYACILES